MPGKRYRPVVSASQRRALFAKARDGSLPMHEALGKARAAKRLGKTLPERIHRKTRGKRRS